MCLPRANRGWDRGLDGYPNRTRDYYAKEVNMLIKREKEHSYFKMDIQIDTIDLELLICDVCHRLPSVYRKVWLEQVVYNHAGYTHTVSIFDQISNINVGYPLSCRETDVCVVRSVLYSLPQKILIAASFLVPPSPFPLATPHGLTGRRLPAEAHEAQHVCL